MTQHKVFYNKLIYDISYPIPQIRCTSEPLLYKVVHFKTVLDIRWFKSRPQECCIQTKTKKKMYR